jgi:uncharacterized protein YcbX
VKSLALARVERANVQKRGIEGDRRFFMVDAAGKLLTIRQHFPFVQVGVDYDVTADRLTLRFPDGAVAEGTPEPSGEPFATPFHGTHEFSGRIAGGPFAEALSAFAGQPVRLVRVDEDRTAYDGFPVSICTRASLAAFAGHAGRPSDDGRRFRQNIYVDGASSPHEEDTWIGGPVRVGGALLKAAMQDERCVVTTRDPDTGEHDLNTLKLLASYRNENPGAVHFGVYCTVREPGEITVGDAVTREAGA